MKLYFLRHGQADWPAWARPDDERPLNDRGQKQMRRVARSLAALKVKPDVILSSPLPRAYQTAEIAAGPLKLTVTMEGALAPGFDAEQLAALLRRYAGLNVMLVGHEPDFSRVIGALTGGAVRMAKAGLARVDINAPGALRGELVWLAPPKLLDR